MLGGMTDDDAAGDAAATEGESSTRGMLRDFDPQAQANPHPQLAAMRAAGAVIELAPGTVQVVGRAANEAVLRNHDRFSSATGEPTGGSVRPLIPLRIDPPQHIKFRKLLDPIFAPKIINPMVEPITKLMNDHIDAIIDTGRCVFDEDIAVPFPSQVFLTIAGLPLADLDLLLRLKDGILRPGYREGLALDDLEGRQRVNKATVVEVYDYFQAAIDDRRREPRHDMLTLLTTSEIDGDRLTDEDILDICFLFLIAGLDTVADSLTLMFVHLAQHHEVRQQIVDDPGVIP